MSYQPIKPSGSTATAETVDIEEHELPSWDDDQPRVSPSQKHEKKHPKLESSWKPYWKTQATMLTLFFLGITIPKVYIFGQFSNVAA